MVKGVWSLLTDLLLNRLYANWWGTSTRGSGNFDRPEVRAIGLFYLISRCPLRYWSNASFFPFVRKTPYAIPLLNNVLIGLSTTWAAVFMSLGRMLSGPQPQLFLSFTRLKVQQFSSTGKKTVHGLQTVTKVVQKTTQIYCETCSAHLGQNYNQQDWISVYADHLTTSMPWGFSFQRVFKWFGIFGFSMSHFFFVRLIWAASWLIKTKFRILITNTIFSLTQTKRLQK